MKYWESLNYRPITLRDLLKRRGMAVRLYLIRELMNKQGLFSKQLCFAEI